MKIKRFIFGMFEDKIVQLKSTGLMDVLSDKNYQFLKSLAPEDSGKYFWLPTEQLIALPYIKQVEDKAGRTFIQNQTVLIKIHDYLKMTDPSAHLSQFFIPNLETAPDSLEPVTVT